MAAKKLKHYRSVALLIFAFGAALLLCPGARAQVPTPQTGGSGENAPPPTPTAADTATAKPKPQPKAKPAAQTAVSKKKKDQKKQTIDVNTTAEPDKVLYDRAQADLKAGRYIEGRLALQTLINTYPDSEYLAKAKLAVADSYYKEGGTTNLTQSIQEYNDFRTFFPFLDEAAYAQMQIGLAHYKMMEKSDRDKTQGEAAEDAFRWSPKPNSICAMCRKCSPMAITKSPTTTIRKRIFARQLRAWWKSPIVTHCTAKMTMRCGCSVISMSAPNKSPRMKTTRIIGAISPAGATTASCAIIRFRRLRPAPKRA
jgi:hypothetical protein